MSNITFAKLSISTSSSSACVVGFRLINGILRAAILSETKACSSTRAFSVLSGKKEKIISYYRNFPFHTI